MLKWLCLSAVIVVLDQASKIAASAALRLYEPVAVMPYFNFTLLHNEGAAFSFLSQAGGWQRWFFTGIALLISGVIIVWLYRLPKAEVWTAAALSLVLGGAVGNVVDRIRFGYVVDFIDVYYGAWHWPAFNIADAAISVGAVLLITQSLKKK